MVWGNQLHSHLYKAKLAITILQVEYNPSGDQLAVHYRNCSLYILTRTSKSYNYISTFTLINQCRIALSINLTPVLQAMLSRSMTSSNHSLR
ncbi:hypothetical protein CYY_009709 [Polysphondylium violaceum]|uniref:Uncharacterized protein n=1 Tax=Polysphondylium violaceum TaxID=133409 RepID=A0A8J4V2P2_9MYCE|nr:hypothetical protein CYY_009709 [Polysphondylium violaceum]